jgi:hypothetical protein
MQLLFGLPPAPFELDEMSAGQGVHRPTRIVLQLVVELGEARGIRGQDVHLLFDKTNAARQLQRLGEGGERVRPALTLATRSGDTAPPARSRPRVVATVTGTSSGSDRGASSATQAPSANLGSRRRAASLQRLVLPIPPGPTRVTRRWEVLRSRISSSSTARPISSETGSGRFVGGRDGVESAEPSPQLRADQVAIGRECLTQGRDLGLQAAVFDCRARLPIHRRDPHDLGKS